MLKKELVELKNENSKLKQELKQSTIKLSQAEKQVKDQYDALEEQGMQLVEAQQAVTKSQRSYEFERTCRE